jgi:hypothetical protein
LSEGALDAPVTCDPDRGRLRRFRGRLVAVGGGVERMYEPLVGIASLPLAGDSAECPDRDGERERQQQQSRNESQASAGDSPYFFPPGPCPWSP